MIRNLINRCLVLCVRAVRLKSDRYENIALVEFRVLSFFWAAMASAALPADIWYMVDYRYDMAVESATVTSQARQPPS